ncbi:MAG: hypothetical protein JNM36_05080 [Chitinophagales bacterium]|nr:hypothetical protein [Chitinophagales bacterium]
MPINDLGNKHFSPQDMSQIDAHISAIEVIVATIAPNLTDEERQKYGSINEQNKLLVNKVHDYASVSPHLCSPDVNWAEFERDYQTRQFADTRLLRLENVMKMLKDTKIVHDYDNYRDTLVDYDHAKYKSGTNTPGYTEKTKELSQFFPRTGTASSKKEDDVA